jgi:hypothetical protein
MQDSMTRPGVVEPKEVRRLFIRSTSRPHPPLTRARHRRTTAVR